MRPPKAEFSNPKETEYLFIDGACLRNILKDLSDLYYGGNPIDFNYGRFAQEFDKVFYYDAMPPIKTDETEEAYENRTKGVQQLFDKIGMLDGFHVYMGTARKRKKVIEQKKVDIKIAVDMLKHAFTGNITRATLLTSDLDFKPVLDTYVENGKHISLMYGDTRNTGANKELITSADKKMRIGINFLGGYVSANFIKKYPFAKITTGGNPNYTNRLNAWTDADRGEIVHFYEIDRHILRYTEQSTGTYTFIEHEDLSFLTTFAAEEYQITIPDQDLTNASF